MNRGECTDILLDAFTNFIDNDYILLDVPYYANVGDVLIWQSTLDLLKKIKHKCLYTCSYATYTKPNIDKNVIIVFLGGGNFGDLWFRHQQLRHQVMADFPENKIVQLPQSVCFKSAELLKEDIDIFARHKGNLIICLRDTKSYNFVKEHYTNAQIELLPDTAIAFEIENYYKSQSRKKNNNVLFVKRNDCELCNTNIEIPQNAVVSDWPSMQKTPFMLYVYWLIRKMMLIFRISQKTIYRFTNAYYRRILKDIYIKSGIKFLQKYDTIYSTRLHVAVLGWLLNKNVFLIDNSYGKCKGVVEQWLSNQSNIQMI